MYPVFQFCFVILNQVVKMFNKYDYTFISFIFFFYAVVVHEGNSKCFAQNSREP